MQTYHDAVNSPYCDSPLFQHVAIKTAATRRAIDKSRRVASRGRRTSATSRALLWNPGTTIDEYNARSAYPPFDVHSKDQPGCRSTRIFRNMRANPINLNKTQIRNFPLNLDAVCLPFARETSALPLVYVPTCRHDLLKIGRGAGTESIFNDDVIASFLSVPSADKPVRLSCCCSCSSTSSNSVKGR